MNCQALVELLTQSAISTLECAAISDTTVVFTSPFQHDDGDLIEFVLTQTGDCLTISDAGETCGRLFLAGYEFSKAGTDGRRFNRALAQTTGVRLFEEELQIECDAESLFSAIASLATAIARVESSLQPSAAQPREHFSDHVATLLATSQIPFEMNRPFAVATHSPVMAQFYIPKKNTALIGYALSGTRRVSPPLLKAKLYDIGRLRSEQQEMLLPFMVFPDSASTSEEEQELLHKDKVRYFNVPEQKDDFLTFLRQAA